MLTRLLSNCYYNDQPWQENILPEEIINKYFEEMIRRGNIITIAHEGELLGYVEFHRLNFEQFGRVTCKAEFFPLDENTVDGEVCYIANLWIKDDMRKGKIFEGLEKLFFAINHNANYFTGFRVMKNKSMKVYHRSQIRKGLLN